MQPTLIIKMLYLSILFKGFTINLPSIAKNRFTLDTLLWRILFGSINIKLFVKFKALETIMHKYLNKGLKFVQLLYGNGC